MKTYDWIIAIASIASIWVLKINKIVLESYISGIILGIYIGWRVFKNANK